MIIWTIFDQRMILELLKIFEKQNSNFGICFGPNWIFASKIESPSFITKFLNGFAYIQTYARCERVLIFKPRAKLPTEKKYNF